MDKKKGKTKSQEVEHMVCHTSTAALEMTESGGQFGIMMTSKRALVKNNWSEVDR